MRAQRGDLRSAVAALALCLGACDALTAGADGGPDGGAPEQDAQVETDQGTGGGTGGTGGTGGETGGAGGETGGATGGATGGSGGETGGAGGEIGGAGGETGGAGGTPTCETVIPPEDRDRVVLLGHGFTADPEVPGTTIHALTLTEDGEINDDGTRLDIGVRPARIEFSPDGAYAYVLGADGAVVSVAVNGVDDLQIVSQVQLPSADYGDMHLSDDGRLLWVVGSNSTEAGGISAIELGCAGELTLNEGAFFPVLLAESMAVLPDKQQALLLGGQALFDPVNDVNDVRLINRDGEGWSAGPVFDVFGDFVTADRIGVSPDGATAIIPNNSPFSNDGNQVSILTIEGDVVSESNRLQDVPDVREVLFSTDGETVLLSQAEGSQVTVLRVTGAGEVESAGTVDGVGLASQMAPITRGQLAGTVILPATDAGDGPQVVLLHIDGPGEVSETGRINLGEGSENIPDAVAVQP